MPNGTLPEADAPVPAADLKQAAAWLAGHDLADVPPTPLLATRLMVRQRRRLAASLMMAAFIIAVSLVYVGALTAGSGTYRRWSLLGVTVMVVGLVAAQALLDWWVRRVDRRAAATLPRRAAHPVRLGWRTVLGRPHAAFAAVTFAAAAALAIGVLTTPDAIARYMAVVLLIGLCGLAAGLVVQLRHILAHPVVADDEVSLTADVIMRVEDARDVAVPTVVWSLPVVSVPFGWWTIAWMVFIVLSVGTLALITARTPRCAAVARRATGAE